MQSVILRDCHSRLESAAGTVVRPGSAAELARLLESGGGPLIAHGGRHAMGGQQFLSGMMLDTSALSGLLQIDARSGFASFGAGTTFDRVIEDLARAQSGRDRWTIRQKPTGVDSITLGGALSSNIHGRGLDLAPFVSDVESFELVTAAGEILEVTRDDPRFALVAGGYGLFGVVTKVTLRLSRRKILTRRVALAEVDDLIREFSRRTSDGALYGDWQFAIDEKSDSFLTHGILSTYHPHPDEFTEHDWGELTTRQASLAPEMWRKLIALAHSDKARAFAIYKDHYLKTDGQIYASDTMQLSTYMDDYHDDLTSEHKGSEIITELFVDRRYLAIFMRRAASLLRARQASVIYGTVRLIKQDKESFLAWAARDFACIVFNLHTSGTRDNLQITSQAFQDLIDLALALGGKYYLTYHRFARADQLRAAYPQIEAFLDSKNRYDPANRLDSLWLAHQRALLGHAVV